uniref:Uncharacterized protein n=1 Tax=Arundo donax TaxID=35708 RepID=A0A0A9DL69_ARUDO
MLLLLLGGLTSIPHPPSLLPLDRPAMAMAAVAASRLPPAAARPSTSLRSPFSTPHSLLIGIPLIRMTSPPINPIPHKSRLVVASAQSNFSRVVQTVWSVGKDAVEAGTNLVPGSVPRPVARIGVTFAAVSVALFLLKSVVSTAFFVLAMMGLIYLGFLAMNPKEASGSRMDEAGGNASEDPVEEARRIMEKYK